MAPSHHTYTNSHSQYQSQSHYPRHSTLPGAGITTASSGSTGSTSTPTMSATKTRQYANLQAQLAQLNANLADTENLLRMTAVQAEDMRFLGGYVGGLFMGSAKVLGEEGVKDVGGGSREG